MVPVHFQEQFVVLHFWHSVINYSLFVSLLQEFADFLVRRLTKVQTELVAGVLSKVTFHVVRGLQRQVCVLHRLKQASVKDFQDSSVHLVDGDISLLTFLLLVILSGLGTN